MKRVLVAAVAATVLTALGVAPAAAVGHTALAPAFACDGTFVGGTYDRIVVPAGGTCVLDGTVVQLDVEVRRGASFTATNASVDHDVDVFDAKVVDIEDSSIGNDLFSTLAGQFKLYSTDVGNDLTVQANKRLARIGSAGCLVDPTIGGDVRLIENSGAVAACGLTIGGSYIANGNFGDVGLFTSSVGADGIHVLNNTGPATRVKHLTTTGVLECVGNRSDIFRSNFNQASEFVGQCQR